MAQPVRAFLHEYALNNQVHTGELRTDGAELPGTPFCYANPLMESLLETLCSRVDIETGLTCCPRRTPTFASIAKATCFIVTPTVLRARSASPSISAVAESGRSGSRSPGAPREIRLQPGDALLYRGVQLPPGRTSPGRRPCSCSCTTLSARKPTRKWIFDKRPRLGTSPAARQIIQRLVGTPALRG